MTVQSDKCKTHITGNGTSQREFQISSHTQCVHGGISYEHQTAQSQAVYGDDEARNVGCWSEYTRG